MPRRNRTKSGRLKRSARLEVIRGEVARLKRTLSPDELAKRYENARIMNPNAMSRYLSEGFLSPEVLSTIKDKRTRKAEYYKQYLILSGEYAKEKAEQFKKSIIKALKGTGITKAFEKELRNIDVRDIMENPEEYSTLGDVFIPYKHNKEMEDYGYTPELELEPYIDAVTDYIEMVERRGRKLTQQEKDAWLGLETGIKYEGRRFSKTAVGEEIIGRNKHKKAQAKRNPEDYIKKPQ